MTSPTRFSAIPRAMAPARVIGAPPPALDPEGRQIGIFFSAQKISFSITFSGKRKGLIASE